MKNEYLLQNEFIDWLHSESDLLCFIPLFYNTQINKLNRLSVFKINENSLSDVLENHLICNNSNGVEETILKILNLMEQNEIQNDINIRELEGLRIGLLKYRLFLHYFISIRNVNFNNQNKRTNYFSDIKQLSIETFIKSNTSYAIPIYHDTYVYNRAEIDALWQVLLSAYTDQKHENKKEHAIVAYDLGSLIVAESGEKYLEVVDGGQTFITLSILIHVLRAFSTVEKNVLTSEVEFKSPAHFIKFNTGLNDQRLFRVLVNNGINKRATTAGEISKGIPYKCEEPGLNMGYHFLQTTFRFVQLVHESKIPQSDHYISDMNDFVSDILKNSSIKVKQLSLANSDKTYLNSNTILIENVMDWL